MKSSRKLVFAAAYAAICFAPLALAQKPNDAAKALIGRWSTSTTDKETRVTETLVIEFRPDGRYVTSIRDSAFKPFKEQQQAQGRYSVAKSDKADFALRIELDARDPESEKGAGTDVAQIKLIDADTLQADDGSIVRRMK